MRTFSSFLTDQQLGGQDQVLNVLRLIDSRREQSLFLR
jgi:hypothetical protein